MASHLDWNAALPTLAYIGVTVSLGAALWWDYLMRHPELLDTSNDEPGDDFGI